MLTRRTFLTAAGAMAIAPRLGARAAADPVRIGQQKLKLADGDRDGLLYVPQNYKPDVPTPLVLMFHGAGSTALNVSYTFPIADANFGGFIAHEFVPTRDPLTSLREAVATCTV